MRKLRMFFVLSITCIFAVYGCGCNKEETISKEDSINVLKESGIDKNVEIITTTETIVNDTKTISTQHDIYYKDKYYHLSENNGISTKTWYGKVNNELYAFYYTKNANNEVTKTSTKIDNILLESAQNQPNSIINSLFDAEGYLLEGYQINGSKQGNNYTIQLTNSSQDESTSYTISIINAKITKIVKTTNIANDSIIETHNYNYDVEDIDLPDLSEYPLNVNG